ncbi:hypothetical protein WA026_017511 [Henosepilachna vigintioctopunctata]|uniref:Prostaglandin reductase 1 n=1 Tax=Henosepilachna vigintioctopunctata TaxID=420089 RepID=A0AAW1V1F8_9CUCU
MVKGKKFVLQKHFNGFPKESDVLIQEEELPPLQDGQFLCESLYISVDPYQRAYPQKVGSVVLGSQVARIIESKHPEFPVGKHVIAYYGWKTHHILDGTELKLSNLVTPPPMIIPDSLDVPLSYFLGVLGLTGISAYFGFLNICRPKPGETVVVTGAAGAVGSIVGQIAKIKKCKVIGVVGSDEKGQWITKDLGFDAFINYKTDNISKALKELAPEGVDCYFDNVGGEISNEILKRMNEYGRISVCGSISNYNDTEESKAPAVQRIVVGKQLKMEGFLFKQFLNDYQQGVMQLTQWLKEGKIKSKETITEGFENTFKAFTDMLKGKNYGKAVVHVTKCKL